MLRLFKAFIFKIFRDLTFRITLIIGAGIAIFMALLYALLDASLDLEGVKMLTGQGMLVNSMSPVQNYGIAIPVNLITFTCLEFSQGTIRNKIIAGHSKAKIYASLFLSGLIFAFLLLGVYLGICTALGTIFGGFDLDVVTMAGTGYGMFSAKYILQMLLACVVTYISVVSFTIFFATLFRSIGPSIPVVMILLMICYLGATIVSAMALFDMPGLEILINFMKVINPLYALGSSPSLDANNKFYLENDVVIASVISNLVYATIFFVGGIFIFKKRDVK